MDQKKGFDMRRFKVFGFSLLLLAVTMLLGLPGVFSAQAHVIDPKIKVGLSSTALVTTGGSISSRITIGLMPSFNSFDVILKADPAVLTPKSITIGGLLPGAVVRIFCLNGNTGIGCVAGKDGPGVAHLAVTSSATSAPNANGTLFKVGWKALNGVGAFGTVGTTVTIPCQIIALNGVQIAGITVFTSVYGTVPAAAQPTATISANQTSITIPHGKAHNVTISANGVNGFSSVVLLSSATSSSSVTALLISKVLSCDCGVQPTSQLQIKPLTPGTFTVTVVGKIGKTIVGIITVTVTST